MCGSDIFLGLIAILFPPLAVWIKRGICSADSVINLALCCLGFLPGLLHAWYIIAITPDPTFYEEIEPDPERGGAGGGTVAYYYVQRPQSPSHGGYGTMNAGVAASAPAAQFPGQGQQQGFVQPQAGPSAPDEVPPTYQQAVQGDHKIQGP